MLETNKIINGDCIEVMKTFPEKSVDLVLTSPPYNAGIKYDVYNDTLSMDEYWEFTKEWLEENGYKPLSESDGNWTEIAFCINDGKEWVK